MIDREKARARWRRYYATHQAERKAYRRARYRRLFAVGSCVDCGAERQPMRTRCFDCARKLAGSQAAYFRRSKAA